MLADTNNSLHKTNAIKNRLSKIEEDLQSNPMYEFDKRGLISNIVNETGDFKMILNSKIL